jgi:hypothetical protein
LGQGNLFAGVYGGETDPVLTAFDWGRVQSIRCRTERLEMPVSRCRRLS